MARSPNEKAEKARKLYKDGMKLVEIADRLKVPAGTVRRWKSTYHWDGEHQSERSEKKSERSENKKSVTKRAVADEVEAVIQNTDLTDKQQLFCIYYIRCFNATKAYQKAYGSDYTTAMVNGHQLLRNTKVKDEILRLKQERLNREFLSETDIFQKYMDIAFADVTDFVTVKGETVRMNENVDGSLIDEITGTAYGVKVKLADRMKALQWLSDHMDLATDKQRAEIALLKSRADAGKDDRENKLDKFFEQIEGALKDAE